jgi:MinD-like ATPase involved in chromosome partitioning or flagellar assembly
METITFYSYKGGTGRSLAVANAAVYLAKLGFKVAALDFDLEAPGLHYKLSRSESGTPLAVGKGAVDYVNEFLEQGEVRTSLEDFMVDVTIPGIAEPLVHLMPAGRVPSAEYWTKLTRINWHKLFYEGGAQGVQIFKELQVRIFDEFKPDFLLVDSRTGITEMGGVATTLMADKVLCLVSTTLENLEGSRAVLRSLKKSRRESRGPELEIMVAVSRLPEMRGPDEEREVTDRIVSVLNQESEDTKDTLSIKSVFVLHNEAALQVTESLRVGSGSNPDDSILYRDYLRLFASFVPRESIQPKVNDLMNKAWEKLRTDPDAAVKDMEEYAESFGHPETYRELLRFYQVRNAPSLSILRRAQRLWEITRDSSDQYLWSVVSKHFEPTPSYQTKPNEWHPSLEFLRALWRDAGGRDQKFGLKLANTYSNEDRDSLGADILLEVIRTAEPSASVVSRCVFMLDYSNRKDEAEELIQRFKAKFAADPNFAMAWARHALNGQDKAAATEIAALPVISRLSPSLAARLYVSAGNMEGAATLAQPILSEIAERGVSARDLDELAMLFREIGRWDEFEKAVGRGYPSEVIRDLRERPVRRRR